MPTFPQRRKPCPDGFAETFIVAGWRGVEAAFGARTDCNKRWIAECGGDALKAARSRYRRELEALRRAA
jgi:hypothetical protein